jgi:hypothetical protein
MKWINQQSVLVFIRVFYYGICKEGLSKTMKRCHPFIKRTYPWLYYVNLVAQNTTLCHTIVSERPVQCYNYFTQLEGPKIEVTGHNPRLLR